MLEETAEVERRDFERIATRCPIKFRAERENVLLEGTVRDICDIGAGFFTRQKLVPDLRLETWIELAMLLKPLNIRGKVIWAQRQDEGLWRAGIMFDEMAFIKIVKMLIGRNN